MALSRIDTRLIDTEEKTTTLTSATGTVVHNLDTSLIFIHKTVSANFTANFTNVNTDNDNITTVVLVIFQGATGYIPNAVQINGVSQTIQWANGSAPSPNANKKDVFSFSLIRESSTWLVLGQASTFG